MWTIPTLMTLARIAAIPLIVGLFYLPIETAERNLWATVMFVVFALTDWLDGYLARNVPLQRTLACHCLCKVTKKWNSSKWLFVGVVAH